MLEGVDRLGEIKWRWKWNERIEDNKNPKIGRVLYEDDDNVIILEFTCHSRAHCIAIFCLE